MNNHYNDLIKKLDAFVRKYYLNKLVRGILLFLLGIAALALLIGVGEYFLYLPAWFKTSLLILIGLGSLWVLLFWIIMPLLKMGKIGKVISHTQAATIIGRFFPEIQDKLLNILQLHGAGHSGESEELALAGIEQKSAQISLFPVLNAVNIKANKKYLVWLFPIVILIAAITLLWPQVFKDAAFRFSRPTENFYKPAPFDFILLNKSLEVPLDGNYKINLKVDGKEIPNQVNVVLNGQSMIMESDGKTGYSFTINKINQNTPFYFEAAGFRSKDFKLMILERPKLEKLALKVEYPSYTGLKNETMEGFSNLSVPEGTRLSWQLTTQNTDTVLAQIPGKRMFLLGKEKDDNHWNFFAVAGADTLLRFFLSNKKLPRFDTLQYNLQTIPDRAPIVSAQQNSDSISKRQILITGTASDDYGLSRLLFHYNISDPQGKSLRDGVVSIMPTHNAKSLDYDYYFDVNTFQLKAGQHFKYYIETWDNDAIHGPKKGLSEVFTYKQADERELDKQIKENNSAIDNQMANSNNEAKNINEDLDKFKDQLLQNNEMSWEQQDQLKSLTEREENLQKQLDALKKRFQMQQQQAHQKQYSPEVQQKQQELQKQLDQIKDKNLAEQLKKLQDLLNKKGDRDKTFQQVEQWQQENKMFQMDMERIQSLMKQLTMQMKLEDLADKAKSLAKNQSDLSKQTQSGQKPKADLNKEQKDLSQQLSQMMNQDFKDLEKANSEMDAPQDLSKAKEQGKGAQQSMQNSQNSMNQGQMGKAGSQQQDAANKLGQMASNLTQMAGGMDMQMVDINIKAVRQLLTNLIRYSFDQENLIKEERKGGLTVPILQNQLKRQHVLEQNTRMIKDSLFALSKRVFQLAPTINKETSQLTDNLGKALNYLESRQIAPAQVSQQFAMTNANNLALMLDETLRNLMQMQMMGGGSGSSGQPMPGQQGKGQGKGSSPGQMMKDIITGQQQMGKGMGQMQGQGKPGGKTGQGQSGGQNGGEEQAEKLAELAQQQAAIRNMMQDVSNMLNSQGNGQNAELIRQIQKEMNKNETDLVNRRLNSELIQRQQEIMSRLLKAQDAIRNQETDNKRLSKTAQNLVPPMPPELKEVLEKRKAFLESYQTIPADLKPFYKKMSETYQRQIGGSH